MNDREYEVAEEHLRTIREATERLKRAKTNRALGLRALDAVDLRTGMRIRSDRYYTVDCEVSLVAETSVTGDFIGKRSVHFPSKQAAMKAASACRKYLRKLAKEATVKE